MSDPRIREILDRFLPEPAPFLPIMHGIQDAFGHIPEHALSEVSGPLGIPPADLFGTVSFYHFFNLDPSKPPADSRICGGPVCALKDLDGLERNLGGTVERISCPGRCDIAVPCFRNGRVYAPVDPGSVTDPKEAESPLPPETGLEECLFAEIRNGGRRRFDWRLFDSVREDPEKFLRVLDESGLVGRGGAGFPTGAKWRAVREERAPVKYVICNADEGEPGCFKDRVLMDHDPVSVLEGMVLAGILTGARIGIVYLRWEYPETMKVLEETLRGLELPDFRIHLRRGAGAYICGEETSLLNSLEGRRPFPRDKPPFPTTHGLFGAPTVINNVETFAAVPHIFRKGAAWYRSLGIGDNAGTKIFSVSGDVKRPGNYELPLGTPLRELIEGYAGGVREGKLKAVTMAGISGGFLGGKALDVRLDIPSVREAGSLLGAGGIIVYSDARCMVRAARACMNFFARESCGKCFPCRIGTVRSTEMLDEIREGRPRADVLGEMTEVGRVMGAASACGLGLAAPFVTRSLLRYWPEEVSAHMKGRCLSGECRT